MVLVLLVLLAISVIPVSSVLLVLLVIQYNVMMMDDVITIDMPETTFELECVYTFVETTLNSSVYIYSVECCV